MEGRVPQVERTALAKADWLWGSRLLQTMPFVTLTSTQALLHLFHAFSLQALGFLLQAGRWGMPQPALGHSQLDSDRY